MFVTRQNRPSEETFRMEIWSQLIGLSNCVWYPLPENAIDYIQRIKTSLEKMEKQLLEENPKIIKTVEPDPNQNKPSITGLV